MSLFNILLRCLLAINIILLLNIVSCTYATKRHIECKIDDKIDFNFIQVSAERAEDIVYYLWSSYKLPSVIVARTTNDTVLNVDADKLRNFQEGAFQFSKKPLAVIGLTISELWELSYKDDVSDIDEFASVSGLGLEFFNWSSVLNATSCSTNSASAKFKSSDKLFSKNGAFGVEFSVAGDVERAADFPHLIYSGNSTQVKVTLDKLYSNNSRTLYGLELKLFSDSSKSCTSDEDKYCKMDVVDFISDEFSPGVFSDVNVILPCSTPDSEMGSFLTWRPVTYTSKVKSVANSSDLKFSRCPSTSIITPKSIAELYFSDQSHILSNIFNVTFGAVGDGFYGKTNYATWSFMLGSGMPVSQTLSTAAIVATSVGAGAMVLFLMSGGIFFIIQFSLQKNYDLLLSENCMN